MSEIIEKVRKGNIEAMKHLYEANKKKVTYICNTFMGESDSTTKSIIAIFKNSFKDIINGQITSEEDFTAHVVNAAVSRCKGKLTKNKDFKIPQNKNFSYVVYDNSKMNLSGNVYEIVINNLPLYQKFTFILHYIFNIEPAKIAKHLNTTEKIVNDILSAEQANIDRIMISAKKDDDYSSGSFHDAILAKVAQTDVNTQIDSVVVKDISEIAEPILKKARKKKIKISVIAICALVIVCIAVAIFIPKENVQSTIGGAEGETDITVTDDANVQSNAETTPTSNEEITHYADIEVENHGTITVALNGNTAPKTVENFVKLANEGFYDGLTFHRIMDGFMMQGGDPNGDGTGGSETNVVGEFSENGFENPISHTRGTISMARSGDPDSGSSQFFIVHEDSTFLDGQYAAFGHVTEGMDIVDAICTSTTPTDDNGTIPKEQQPIITSIKIR